MTHRNVFCFAFFLQNHSATTSRKFFHVQTPAKGVAETQLQKMVFTTISSFRILGTGGLAKQTDII
jgi:hypothetical protein